jgi:hypothetical protein
MGYVEWTATRGPAPLDLLIVLDENVPRGPAGTTLGAALSKLAGSLQARLDVVRYSADIHLAIVPSNAAGATARLWPAAEACPQVDGDYLRTSAMCDIPSNFTAPIADLLLCASTHLPITGQPSRPLDTLRALMAPGGLAQTTGFRRPTAPLLLAMVTLTDDPSVATPAAQAEAADYLYELCTVPDNLDLFAAAPDDAQGLRAALADARLNAIIDDLGSTAWEDLAWMAEPAEVYAADICIDYPFVDLGSPAGGPQPVCEVIERAVHPDGSASERPVESCPSATTALEEGAPPCWRARMDRDHCPVQGPRIQILQPAVRCRTSDAIRYRVSCQAEYQPVTSADHAWNAPLPCGTADNPVVLDVTRRVPALGATVRNTDIQEGFTLPWTGFEIPLLGQLGGTSLHTAGYVTAGDYQWSPGNVGGDQRYERTGTAWSNAPGHVELFAVGAYQTEDGCYYKLPSPLLSYDVVP